MDLIKIQINIQKADQSCCLDPVNPADRLNFEEIIDDIVFDHDVLVRIDEWRAQTSEGLFYIKGSDVIITKENNEFVTIRQDGINNERVKNARER